MNITLQKCQDTSSFVKLGSGGSKDFLLHGAYSSKHARNDATISIASTLRVHGSKEVVEATSQTQLVTLYQQQLPS